ncbi:hypothetical protein CYMTET_22347 [Cymbomonas tetramitiformis]|uniref:Uncharacterized protein n=1 Tax=Cymbomonas tetramitiformis TaxID=36881 RepID=A0AAE0L2D2_9CHLO|nr:hypothetical protein CYMTET_22347 [Cymbomonas tetramitiformis]
MTPFLSNTSCAALGETVWEYRDYEVSLYNPNIIGDALHNLPRVTDTNFSRFEYEVEEDDYWIGVGVAVAFAFLVGLFTFTIISLQTVFKVLNRFAQSAWTASMLLLETCCPCCTSKDVKECPNSSVEDSFENKRQTMRCSCIWGMRLDTEHRLTLFSAMCAVALGLVGLGIMVVAFASTVDGYDSGLNDADSLKST